ncbi:MAG TPA: HlyD family efflux transporter periplasmic adaptor subunit [Polyangiales bacterium]|nr:HlyD family efflux transporter periplasmic adaptor subunit [Polyangiales bacterium]
MKIWLAAIGGGVLIAIVGLLSWRSHRTTTRVDSGPIDERIVARAVVVPSHGVVHVFAKNDGRIMRVSVHEGDSVESGQALAQIDADVVASPLRAIVLARHAEVGDYALAAAHGASAPLFELADPSQIELRVEVEEADAARVEPKQAVSIAQGRARIAGVVERVSAQLEHRTIGADDARVRAEGMVRVLAVALRGAHPNWPLGMRVEATIELSRRDARTRIARSAISVRDGRSVVERPGLFFDRDVPVEVVAVDEAYAEIRGLAVGDEVLAPAR